jgi:FIMAH domain-containing protein
MNRGIRRAGLFAVAILVAAGSIGSRRASADGPATPAPALPVDADRDGINEGLEQTLAERFAPLIYIEPDESNYPVNVDWFLQRANQQYHEDCFSDTDENIGPFPIDRQLLGPTDGIFWSHGPKCGEDDTGYSHPPHRLLTTIATDPDGQYSVGPLTTGYSDQQTFVLNDLADIYKVGSTDPRDWKTYFHAYPSADGGVMIQYWHVFAYNQFGGGFDNHGGDWDASIQVWLNPDLTLRGVWFSRHADDHPGSFFCASADSCGTQQVRLFDSTHPVVTIDGGGHAAFRSPFDWATCDCRVLEGLTGPLGTVVWTNDTDAFDDPAALRKAQVVCDPMTNICDVTLSGLSGGIVWKTWSNGSVVASGSLTNPIISPSAHGGLVNLGEYNPCTQSSCFGTAQASKLLSGEFHPLNDAFWLRYEGRWGSIGTINSGPRGPVFQGFEDRGEGEISFYRAWYNNGADAPAANDGSHPWLVPPSTTAAIQGPSSTAGGVTFVSGTTLITLSASQSVLADRFGPLSTRYRIYPVGSAAPPFNLYTGAFALASPPFTAVDGAYNVDYFTVDGLGNVETTKTLMLTLDTTAPVASIVQPAVTTYLHSATLTLNYSVSDGSGSGVSSFAPAMDGAATLTDGTGLASGQVIQLLTELSVGPHAFSIDSTDNVGNHGSRSVTFSVVVTADSIKQDVNLFLAAGKIKNIGQANSLLAKLDAAAASRARGQCGTASNQYAAFINELQAQGGEGVDAAAAAIMIADAQYLIAHCP